MLRDQHGNWALDFDEGMGRIVYCDEAGLVSIMDVVDGPAWCPTTGSRSVATQQRSVGI